MQRTFRMAPFNAAVGTVVGTVTFASAVQTNAMRSTII